MPPERRHPSVPPRLAHSRVASTCEANPHAAPPPRRRTPPTRVSSWRALVPKTAVLGAHLALKPSTAKRPVRKPLFIKGLRTGRFRKRRGGDSNPRYRGAPRWPDVRMKLRPRRRPKHLALLAPRNRSSSREDAFGSGMISLIRTESARMAGRISSEWRMAMRPLGRMASQCICTMLLKGRRLRSWKCREPPTKRLHIQYANLTSIMALLGMRGGRPIGKSDHTTGGDDARSGTR